MNNYLDFGFNSDEFLGKLNYIPYAQFMNASKDNYGLAITETNAQITDLNIDDQYFRLCQHEFTNSDKANIFIAIRPRILVLHRSQPYYRGEDDNVYKYSALIKKSLPGKAFSYVVIWLLDKENKPLSKMPLRLLCKGYAGLSFNRQFDYYDNKQSFCTQLLSVYKQATNDQKQQLNNMFYAHAVYEPLFERKKVTSQEVNQSSYAVVTTSFEQPTLQNIKNILIPYNSEVSKLIQSAMELSSDWINLEAIDSDEAYYAAK